MAILTKGSMKHLNAFADLSNLTLWWRGDSHAARWRD
jgi:hypothetical protein